MAKRKPIISEEAFNEVKKFFLVSQIRTLSKDIKKNLRNPFRNWEGFKGAIKNLCRVIYLITTAVDKASEVIKDLKSNQIKLKVAAKFLDELVVLPIPLEWIDDMVFRILISLFINTIKSKEN